MNKPVAWMDYLEHSDVYDLNVSGRGIPLYTHQVKELTDKEIMNIFNDWTNKKQEHKMPANNVDYFYQEMREFAKAILRKAQEK